MTSVFRGVVVALVAGVFLVTQNGINTALKEAAIPSPVATALLSFSVSTVAIGAVATAHRPDYDFALAGAPWYAYCGGLLGAGYVFGAVYLTSQLGFAVFTLCMILGQVLVSLALDITGFLQPHRRVPSWQRLVALCGVFSGTALIMEHVGSDLEGRPPWVTANLLVGAIVSGSGMPIQALLNGVMTKHLGTPFRASTVSFAGGTLVLGALALATGGIGELHLGSSSPWMWTGGLCGALAITGNIIGVAELGAAAYSAIFVSTQLLAAFVFDVIGAFGFDPVEASRRRLLGVLLAAGSAVAYQMAPSTIEPKPDAAGALI